MKKYTLLFLAAILAFTACKKTEDSGNLKVLAKQYMDAKIEEAKSLGADLIITDTLVCNDSVCIFSTINTHPKRNAIAFEYLYLRKRTKAGFEYYRNLRLVDYNHKSVSEKVFRDLAIANTATLSSVMNNEKVKEAASRILYTIAYEDCVKHGQKMQDIKM